jgi:hypothetical protein
VQFARLALAVALLPIVGAAASVSIQYEDGVFKVVGIVVASSVAAPNQTSGLTVTTGPGNPPLFGTYSVENGQPTFRPRYPLSPGVTYYARFGDVSAVIQGPKPVQTPPTRVVALYPSSAVLPDNQLKLYLVFSAPMQGGDEIWSKIHLVDSNGTPAYLPFVSQELWNRDFTRLTLIFDPGRIKRGVKPNVDMGPVLVEGKHYSLIVDRELKDGNGQPLIEPFRHDFAAGPAERRPIDPKLWRLSEPRSGTVEPLVITFDRPLDFALLGDVFQIPGVSGKATIGPGETEWRFQPDQPWKEGEYSLIISMTLEDLAGNRIGRPFDVDEFTSPAPRISSETTSLTFRVRRTP